MKNKLFRKHASVGMTEAKRNGGIPSFGRFLAALGMTALFCWSATAQNGVTVSNLNVSAGTVTFNVSWKKANMPPLWSDTVWVFVDYNNAGKMERLLLSGATLTAPSWTAAKMIFGKDDNKQGAWVVGNARSATSGSFSTTVKLFTFTAAVGGACAYASNYPPVGKYTSVTEVEFTGTPMYNIVLKHEGGGTMTRISDSPFSVPASYTVQSFTDATGAPGNISYFTPPGAATPRTWQIGSQLWSDWIIAIPSGCSTTTLGSSNWTPPVAIKYTDAITVYDVKCAHLDMEFLCPSPWHLPTTTETQALCDAISFADNYALWGFSPHCDRSSCGGENKFEMWSNTVGNATTGTYYKLFRGSSNSCLHDLYNSTIRMYSVRCVR
jgi:hypothetical protein